MAYTYTGTPNQRIQQAQQRISNDGSVAINPTLSAYMQAAQQEQTEEQAVEQQNKANFGVRLGDTLGDVAKNTLDGMLKAGEGLLDFGAGAVGMFAGWFGNEDLKQRASDWTARDLVGEMWESGRQKGLDVDFEDSYINEMSETGQNIVRGVAQGVGQMLPMVAVTALTAGAGGAAAAAGKISATAAKGLAKAGQVANLVGLGASAAGTSTEQALNTDIVDAEGNVTHPTLDRAFLYGLASGAVEMATEKLVGGVFEKFTGTGLADKVINKLSKSVKFGKVVQFGLNIVGEGVEEMVSEAVGKTLETIYNSSDGKMHWESPDMQDVIVSGIVGSLTAAVMGGADVGVRKISPTQSVQDAMLDYENSKKKADNLQRQGKLTAEDIAKFDAENASTLDKISRRYQKASEKTRMKMLETMPGLADLLDIKDGSVKKSVLSDGATEITTQQATQAMSGSLAVSRRTEVANALHERNLSIATNLDEVQRANMSKLEKALKLTGKKSGVDLKVVVAESMPDNAHLDGDIMYISKDRLSSSDSTAQDFSHEAFHFAEGTKEYRAMYDFLRSIKLNGESLVDTAIDKVRNLGYEVDDTIYDKIKNRESLSGQDARQVELALSEINAKAAELLFGDAETIDKLVDRDRSLARKVLSNMRDYAKIIENVFKGEKDSVETLKQMRKGIKLFEDALAASGEDYLRGKSIERQQEIRKQNNNTDKNETIVPQKVATQSRRSDVSATNNSIRQNSEKPTESDIKYSLREDSEGRKLSKEQAEFFKNSKVVDENGNLLVVYHGTPNGNFFTFEYNKSRQTGTDYGKAFYFTTNLKNAKGYAKDNHKDPRIKEYELKRESLKRQILAETDTTKRQELEKQFRNVKVDGKSILEILYDVDYDTGGEVRQVYLNLVNPLIADAQKKYHYEVYPELFKQAIKNGNDGIIVRNVDDSSKYGVGLSDVYIAFYPEQIKLTTNETPTANPDIRYSLREKPIFNDKKTKAELIKRIEGMQLDFYGKYFAANTDASKFFAEDAQGDRLASQIVLMANDSNESNRYAYAEDLADAIINNMVVTDVDPQLLSEKTGLANAVRQYMHKLNLTEDVMKEVKYHYGEKEARVIRMLWGAPNNASTKMSIDDAVSELQSAGYLFGSDNVSDQFIEMLDIVEQSRKDAHRELSKTAKQLLSPEEYDSLREEIRDDILSFMDEKGTAKEWNDYVRSAEREANTILEQARQKAEEKTKLATLEAQLTEEKAKHAYDKQVKELEEKIRDIEVSAELRAADDIEYNKEYHRLVDKVWSEAVSLSADNLKKYNNASDLMNKEFASVVKKLAGIKYRGELKKGATRRIIADFGKWYNVNNPLLTGGLDAQTIEMMMNDASVENIGYLDKFTLNAIETISENQTREAKSGKYKGQKVENNKPLSADELRLVSAVLGSARHVLKNYNTVEVNKKKIVLSDAAIKANKQAQAIAPHVKKHTRIGENVSNAIKSIIDPTALIGEMFGYQDNNPLVDSFKDIQEGATHAQYLTNSFTDIIDDFTKSHKSYKKHLADKIKVGGHEIRVDVALSLYMLSQQADSINGLKNGGWGYVDEKGYWIDCGKLTDSDISSLYDDFTKADKDFLNVARKFFDATGKAMAETDIQYRGYTLINADAKSDYFPITRYSGDMSKPIADAEATRSAMQVSVANYSFTKERVKNERRITVSPILNVINKHAREVGNYCGLAIPIKEFQRIYNCNIGENGATKSIRNTINEQSWSGFNSYITTLLEDIQGISREKNSLANKALNLIRSNIATFALGFNIKTILSQISGYPAISMYVSLDSMAKAMAHSTWYKGTNAQNMLAYSEWAAVKAHDNGLILAETASEKLGKVANMTTVGIQMMDNWMNRLIWNACQCEVEKRTGLKFGTKENMVEAGKLHAEVGRMTQGNNARSELSAMQRSSNALVKMYSMFNSDGFKYISRLYEAAKRASAYKYLNKTNPGTISQQKVRSAHVFMAKAATAIIVSNLVYVLMGQLMKFTLNKDREDEEGNEISFWQDLGMDFASSMVGMIPIVRDIYSLVVEGYDVKDNATEGIMNLAESIKGVIESSMTMIKGDVWDSTDIAKPLKSLIDAIGQVTGIPTRNVYNYVYGFTKRFSPSTAYEWNSIFYNNGYTKDLKKAMQKDDVDLQKTIIGLMLKDNGMTDTSEQVNNRLRELYAQGYTVLPRTVKDTLNYNGETYSLSKKQQTAFKATHGQANKEVEKLIESRSFSSLSAEIQARAIKWIYDYYYENAVFETVGEDADSKNQLFGEVMDISRFAMTIAACKSVENKVDKKGNVIAGSKKQAILQLLQKLNLSNNEILMILAYLGYSIEGNEQAIKNFIGRIGLTRSQQKSLLKYCGIAA